MCDRFFKLCLEPLAAYATHSLLVCPTDFRKLCLESWAAYAFHSLLVYITDFPKLCLESWSAYVTHSFMIYVINFPKLLSGFSSCVLNPFLLICLIELICQALSRIFICATYSFDWFAWLISSALSGISICLHNPFLLICLIELIHQALSRILICATYSILVCLTDFSKRCLEPRAAYATHSFDWSAWLISSTLSGISVCLHNPFLLICLTDFP